jgi:hypothetical protein
MRDAQHSEGTIQHRRESRAQPAIPSGNRKVQEGTFSKPIKVGSARASGWISTEVYDWIDDQIRRSRRAA